MNENDDRFGENAFTRRRYVLALTAVGTVGVAGCTADDLAGVGGTDDDDATEDDGDSTGDNGGDDTRTEDDTVDTALVDDTLTVVYEYAFEMEVTPEGTDDTIDYTGRFIENDYYLMIDSAGAAVEHYYVDGDHYQVTQDFCTKYSDPDAEPGEDAHAGWFYPEEISEPVEEHPDLSWTRRDEIGGREVYVYDFSEADDLEGDAQYLPTYYVGVADGLVYRVVFYNGTIDYEYDNVEPIEPPDDEDCQEL